MAGRSVAPLKLVVFKWQVEHSPAVTCAANTCGITDNNVVLACPDAQCGTVPPGDRIASYVTKRGNTTYVTYTSNGLPLANLIRDVVPFGNLIADLTEPVLKTLVDSAYYNGNPIPADPRPYRPARLFPPPNELLATAAKIPGAIQQGLSAAAGGASSASMTSTIAVTADAAATDKDSQTLSEKKPKPLTNVVRNSEKAVPGTTGAETPSTADSKPVATVTNSTESTTPTAQEPGSASHTVAGEQKVKADSTAGDQAS